MDNAVTQAQLKTLSDKVDRLDYRSQHHRHLGSDKSQKITTESGQTVYVGFVKNDGTSASPYFLPSGWSVSLVSHLFTITHNLGILNYAAVATPVNTAAVCETRGYLTNSFGVEVFGPSFTLVDVDFTFVLAINE